MMESHNEYCYDPAYYFHAASPDSAEAGIHNHHPLNRSRYLRKVKAPSYPVPQAPRHVKKRDSNGGIHSRICQQTPPQLNYRRKQREAYSTEYHQPIVTEQKVMQEQAYTIVEEGSSADDSTTTNYSSNLSVDVSNEVAAVNQDLDALIERYEGIFDNSTQDQESSNVIWQQEKQKDVPAEERTQRGRKHKRKLIKPLTQEQLKLLSMEKPPIDKLKDIPVHLLKPRLPPSLKERKNNVGNNPKQAIENANPKDKGWLTKEEIMNTLYSDLAKRGWVENQEVFHHTKQNTCHPTQESYSTYPNLSQGNCNKKNPSPYINGNSSFPNMNCGGSEKNVQPHCCSNSNQQFVTTFPNEEKNWRTLLNSSKCKITPVCEHHIQNCSKDYVLGNCGDIVNTGENENSGGNSKYIENANDSENLNVTDKGTNTEPLNWGQIFEKHNNEISHTYEDISANFLRNQNCLNKTMDCYSLTEYHINGTNEKTCNEKRGGELSSVRDSFINTVSDQRPANASIDIGNTSCDNEHPVMNLMAIDKKNKILSTGTQEKQKCNIDNISQHQYIAPKATTIKKNFSTQAMQTESLVDEEPKIWKTDHNRSICEDETLTMNQSHVSKVTNLLEGHNTKEGSSCNVLPEEVLMDQTRRQNQVPKKRPNTPLIKTEHMKPEFQQEDHHSAGGDTTDSKSDKDDSKKTLAQFIDQTLKKDIMNLNGDEGNKRNEECAKSNENLDTNLCVEIIRRLTDSMVKCEKSGLNSHITKESVYLQQLKQLRTDYWKHILREIKHIEDLDRFLLKFGISAQLVYSTDTPPKN